MSTTTITTALREEAKGSSSIFLNLVVRLKLTAFALFGSLVVLDSLYLALCYITFDFFGAFNSPFFAWLRTGAFAAQLIYFPLFAGAILSLDVGQTDQAKRNSQVLAAVLLIGQIVVGFLFYFSPGARSYIGWVWVYGPNVHKPLGGVQTYFEALACLAPLCWISTFHIASFFRKAPARAIPNTLKLSAFLTAAILVSLLYESAAGIRLAHENSAFPLKVVAFVVAANVVVALALFTVLQWIRIAANRFSNPRLAQFAMRCAAAWLLLTEVFRKLVFALLAFNDQRADWYSAFFALAVVIFPAALMLRIKEQSQPEARQEDRRKPATRWILHGCGAVAIGLVFYFCAIRFVSIDWAHAIGSLGAVITSAGLFWLCATVWRGKTAFRQIGLLLLSLTCLGSLGAITVGVSRGQLAASLEQYGDYDSSAFILQHAFKPAMQEAKYAAWYDFLNQHANIRPDVPAPLVPIASEFRPAKGRKPNIFILVIDALRRDYVSAYNPAVHFTPNLDAFAHDSTVFRHAYTLYAGTALADPAMWSGFQQINKTFVTPLPRENNLQPMLDADGYDSYLSHNTVVNLLSGKNQDFTLINSEDFRTITEEMEDSMAKRKSSGRPFFLFAQPANVHSLWLAWHGDQAEVKPHPGFNDAYASAVERVDDAFGRFVAFLKQQGIYENSIIIVTADHGESLGEMGRESHVTNVTPEVIEIPLLVHLPQWEKAEMVWDEQTMVTLHDLTPTLYYLLGHGPLNRGEMLGHALFTKSLQEQADQPRDHYFLMSSYGAVFGVLSSDRKSLFMVDAVQHRNYYYDLVDDPHAIKNRITAEIRDRYEPIIREDLRKIDRFYDLSENSLSNR